MVLIEFLNGKDHSWWCWSQFQHRPMSRCFLLFGSCPCTMHHTPCVWIFFFWWCCDLLWCVNEEKKKKNIKNGKQFDQKPVPVHKPLQRVSYSFFFYRFMFLILSLVCLKTQLFFKKLFSLFLLLFISLIIIFGTVCESHCIILIIF